MYRYTLRWYSDIEPNKKTWAGRRVAHLKPAGQVNPPFDCVVTDFYTGQPRPDMGRWTYITVLYAPSSDIAQKLVLEYFPDAAASLYCSGDDEPKLPDVWQNSMKIYKHEG